MKKVDKNKVGEALQELSNAAFCLGAVKHKSYKEPRKELLLTRARQRVENAVSSYHEVCMAVAFLNRNGEVKNC